MIIQTYLTREQLEPLLRKGQVRGHRIGKRFIRETLDKATIINKPTDLQFTTIFHKIMRILKARFPEPSCKIEDEIYEHLKAHTFLFEFNEDELAEWYIDQFYLYPPNTPNTCLLYTSPSPRD